MYHSRRRAIWPKSSTCHLIAQSGLGHPYVPPTVSSQLLLQPAVTTLSGCLPSMIDSQTAMLTYRMLSRLMSLLVQRAVRSPVHRPVC